MLYRTALKVNNFLHTKSLRSILLFSFLFISIIPIVLLQFISYNRLIMNFKDNIDRLSLIDVNRTRDNLEILLASYEDILYQVYTDDELIARLTDIDRNPFLHPVYINQIRRQLQLLCNIKDYIEAITIITKSGGIIFYDKISGSYTNSSWLGSVSLTQDEILSYGMSDYNTKILPTHSTTRFAVTHYIFHLIHRIIDYKDIENDIGIVVLTLNEEILSVICNTGKTALSFGFIADSTNSIISYPDKSRIGTQMDNANIYNIFNYENNIQKKNISVYVSEPLKNWKIYSIVNQTNFNKEVRYQIMNGILLGIIILIITGVIVITVTDLLSKSLKKVTNAMKQAENGNLSISINKNDIFPVEINTIAEAFNVMMNRILLLVDQIKISSAHQRDAEVKALEAQINPHFLYNILDNINWMAVEKEQYEISEMIVSLAKILRYSINQSNKIVKLRDEISWIKQYLYLQQIRFKNNFRYTLDIDDSLLEIKIYKLIFQPFIENTIIHGFKNRNNNILDISIKAGENIIIKIKDNGNGIKPDALDKIQSLCARYNDSQEEGFGSNEDHLGFANAIGRIKMYYGNKADIQIESRQNEGTVITIQLRGVINENSNSRG